MYPKDSLKNVVIDDGFSDCWGVKIIVWELLELLQYTLISTDLKYSWYIRAKERGL